MERFLEKVDQNGPVSQRRPDLGPCWTWTGNRTPKGYPRFSFGRNEQYAHRACHILFVGPIPSGWEIDHLCFVRWCVRPSHLEAVTPEENKRRQRRRQAGPLEHGTSHAYTRRGCRCGQCREANALRQRERNRGRQARLATAEVPHGTASTYSNWLCRCVPCTEAWRQRCLEYRQKRKAEQNREAA